MKGPNDLIFKSSKKTSLRLENRTSSRPLSLFKGISKVGKNWQVLIMIDQSKKYIGSYRTEEEAARVYDKYSILVNGIKAKTNFSYCRS